VVLQKLTILSIIVDITGILCGRFCKEVVLTDHNDEVLDARFKFHVLSNMYMLDIWVMLDGHQYFQSV
jgi:hypothetical protein